MELLKGKDCRDRNKVGPGLHTSAGSSIASLSFIQHPFPVTAARDSIVDVRCSISIAVPRSNKISTKKTDRRTISQFNELKTPPRAHKCAGVSLIPSVTCMRWLRLRWRVCVCVCPSRPRTAVNKLQPEPESECKVPVLSASDSQCPPNPRSSAVHASLRLSVCNPKKKTGFRYFRYFPFGRLIA